MNDDPTKLFESLTAAEFLQVLTDVKREVESRPLRLSKPIVLEMDAAVEAAASRLIAPGSVVAILLEQDDQLFSELEAAVRRQDVTEIAEIAQRLLQRFQNDQPDGLLPLSYVPHIAAMRYGAKELASHLFIEPDVKALVELFPYNGGRLDNQAFSVADHYRDESVAQLRTFVIIRPPRLSQLEQEALRQVPDGMSEIHISEAALLPLPAVRFAGWVYRVYRRYRAVQRIRPWRRRYIAGGPDGDVDLLRAPIAEERLRGLTPEATARELLQARRDILLAPGPGGPEGLEGPNEVSDPTSS